MESNEGGSAVGKAIALIVEENLSSCFREKLASGKNTDKRMDDAIELLKKSRKE